MGKDRIRYLVFRHGRWRWQPETAMRRAGFKMATLSPGLVIDGRRVPSAEDKKAALRLNEEWDRYRVGLPPRGVEENAYPKGSIGEAYLRAMALREQERRAKGVIWANEQHSRDDWRRAWKWLEPMFGDCDPSTVTPEDIFGDVRRPDKIGLRPLVVTKVSELEAHRVIKVWRALWAKMASFPELKGKIGGDPSLASANSAPPPRKAIWLEGEAVRLVKRAWHEEYHGLAALLATAWDSQLSPIDARSLKSSQMRQDPAGVWFDIDRAKTGQSAIGTLRRRAKVVLFAYLDRMEREPVKFTLAPQDIGKIFRNRSGRPYSKDTLGDDFRTIRAMVFGEKETRQLADFRRSGTVEAFAGNASPEKVSAKMANSLSHSNKLHLTYSPKQLESVRDVDAARALGRTKLRGREPNKDQAGARFEQTSNKPLTAPDKTSDTDVQ